MKKIGERIKLERKRLGLTQKDFLLKIYMSETSTATLRRWEQGKDVPDLKTLVYMAELFGCDVGYLIADYDQRNHVTADIRSALGISELAIERLRNLKGAPISGAARRKDGKIYLTGPNHVLSELILSKHFTRLLFQLGRYIMFSGDTAESIEKDNNFSIEDEAYKRTINYLRTQKYLVVPRTQVADMYLQSASDTLKTMFREVQERIREESDNGTKK